MSFPPLNWIEDASASTFQDNVRVSLASRKRAFCRGLIFSIFLGAACGLFIWKYVALSISEMGFPSQELKLDRVLTT